MASAFYHVKHTPPQALEQFHIGAMGLAFEESLVKNDLGLGLGLTVAIDISSDNVSCYFCVTVGGNWLTLWCYRAKGDSYICSNPGVNRWSMICYPFMYDSRRVQVLLAII